MATPFEQQLTALNEFNEARRRFHAAGVRCAVLPDRFAAALFEYRESELELLPGYVLPTGLPCPEDFCVDYNRLTKRIVQFKSLGLEYSRQVEMRYRMLLSFVFAFSLDIDGGSDEQEKK